MYSRRWTRAVSIRYPRAQPQSLFGTATLAGSPLFFPSANISLTPAPSLGTHPTPDILAAPRFSSRFSSVPTFIYTAGLPLRDSGLGESLLRAYRRALGDCACRFAILCGPPLLFEYPLSYSHSFKYGTACSVLDKVTLSYAFSSHSRASLYSYLCYTTN